VAKTMSHVRARPDCEAMILRSAKRVVPIVLETTPRARVSQRRRMQ
jgi:hypothetical protein